MFGKSRSSAKTNTPGAEVASWMSFAAAAPLADFDINKNGSNLAVEFSPRSIVVQVGWIVYRCCWVHVVAVAR